MIAWSTPAWALRAWLGIAVAVSFAWTAAPRAGAQENLVNVGDIWKYFKGSEEPPAAWRNLDFDDSAWEEGPSGFGYADNDDMTELLDMQNSYLSLYIRRKVDIPDPNQVALLQLLIRYDDGYVAYFNGVEVGRSASFGTVGTPPPFNMVAPDHEVNATPEIKTFPAAAMATVRAGANNVLAIQGHNGALSSSDFSLIPELRFYTPEGTCPKNLVCEVRPDSTVRLRWTNPITPAPYEKLEVFRNGVSLGSPARPTSTLFTDSAPLAGTSTYTLVATTNGRACTGAGIPSCQVTTGPPPARFRRGDPDDNRNVNLTDGIFILKWLFQSGTAPQCPDAADANDDGAHNLTDGVYLLVHLFQSGPAPPAPGITNCGEDASADTLAACTYASCQ